MKSFRAFFFSGQGGGKHEEPHNYLLSRRHLWQKLRISLPGILTLPPLKQQSPGQKVRNESPWKRSRSSSQYAFDTLFHHFGIVCQKHRPSADYRSLSITASPPIFQLPSSPPLLRLQQVMTKCSFATSLYTMHLRPLKSYTCTMSFRSSPCSNSHTISFEDASFSGA